MSVSQSSRTALRLAILFMMLGLVPHSSVSQVTGVCSVLAFSPTGGGPSANPISAKGKVSCNRADEYAFIRVSIQKEGVGTVASGQQGLDVNGVRELTVSTPCTVGNYRTAVFGHSPYADIYQPARTVYSEYVPIGCSPYFTVTSVSVTEGINSTATVYVTKHGTSGAAQVNFATGGGSAAAGIDYTATSGILQFPSGGTTSRTFQVPVLDDADVEQIEIIGFSLSNPSSGISLGPTGQGASGTISIVDTDVPAGSTISLDNASVSGGHSFYSGGPVSFAYMLLNTGDVLIPTTCQNCSVAGPAHTSWVSPKVAMGAYQARMTTDCPFAYGTFGTWLPLSTTASWGVSLNQPEVNAFCSMTVEISRVINPTVIVDSAVINVGLYSDF